MRLDVGLSNASGIIEKIHERGIPFSMLIDSMDISGTIWLFNIAMGNPL